MLNNFLTQITAYIFMKKEWPKNRNVTPVNNNNITTKRREKY